MEFQNPRNLGNKSISLCYFIYVYTSGILGEFLEFLSSYKN